MNSPELLLNMKSIPTPDSVEYDKFWEHEKYKAEYGVTVDGIFISGWLYWHTQLWTILIDDEDPVNKVVKRVYQHSKFRDNEWIINDSLIEALDKKKGLMIFGSRRLGKSEFISSYLARYAILYEGSQNIITSGNWGDIDVITGKIVIGLDRLPLYFKNGRISDDLRKHVQIGYKDKKTRERHLWSEIVVRNHDEGRNTEAIAGLTASTFIMDEVGKSPFAQVFNAAKPAFTSAFGWRCIPILTGTSGDIKKSSDAEKFFMGPEAHNFIYKELPEEGNRRTGLFISGLYRMEGKVKTTLGEFVQNENGILLPAQSELFKVPFEIKDDQKARAVIDIDRDNATKSPDPTALLKETMYYPLNIKELFLSDDGNNFPIEAINATIDFLMANPDIQGSPATITRDVDGKPRLNYNTHKKPILDYPLKANALQYIKDAAIMIYEPPMTNAPAYLYIAGCDPYNTSSSTTSDSLGSFYIFKRIYDPVAGTFQRRLVASYTARPEHIKEFYTTVQLLLEVYNAIVMPENAAGNTFVQFFDLQNKGYMIADGYNMLQEISPKTKIINNPKGLPPTVAVQKFYKQLVYNYCTEVITIGTDSKGNDITKLGVFRIPDIGLLRELAAFNDDGNFDRYVAFGHVLAHENWADKVYPFVHRELKTDLQSPSNKNQSKEMRSPFLLKQNNPFGVNRKRNAFGL